jgi:hypothetical protein
MKRIIFSILTVAMLTSCDDPYVRVQMEDGEIKKVDRPEFHVKIGDTVIVKDFYGRSYRAISSIYGRYIGSLPENLEPCTYLKNADSTTTSVCVFYHKGVVTE